MLPLAESRPASTGAAHQPAPPVSDTGSPGDTAPLFPPSEGCRRRFPRCLTRCDDDSRPPTETRPTFQSAASIQTQAHRDKTRLLAPSPPPSNARGQFGWRDESVSPSWANVALEAGSRQVASSLPAGTLGETGYTGASAGLLWPKLRWFSGVLLHCIPGGKGTSSDHVQPGDR